MSKYYCALCDFKITVECKHDLGSGIFHCKTCDAVLGSHSPIILNECCEVAYSQMIQEQKEAMKND